MTLTAIIILVLLGILLLLLEFLVVPGTTIAGIGGVILIGVGVYFGYKEYGTLYGHMILLGSIIISIFVLLFALRGATWKKLMLNDEIKGRVNIIEKDTVKPGETGKTITRCAPIGKALFKDEEYEVKTNGEFIDQNREIEIIKVLPNQLIVKLKT